MTSDWIRRALLTRRAFVSATATCGAATLATNLPSDDAEDIAAAERLLGLEFKPAERALAASTLDQQREYYDQLRAHDVPRGTPPALRFDPRPTGTTPPNGTQGAKIEFPTVTTAASDTDLAFASVHELAARLRAGQLTSRHLTQLSIDRLKKHDPRLNCVVTLLESHALELADTADRELAAGKLRGPLHGIPFGAKDLLSHPGAPTTFGATPFKDQVIDEEATVLRKLREGGAVLVAKLSLGALAMGDVWFGGKTRNPWNTEQGSSGSSAGSAAAVAAGLVPFAIGSETLGSIVSPCTRCGATGLRPTFGTVSRHGAMPLSWTMDKLGPIARNAADCALVFDVVRGRDHGDADTIEAPFAWQRNRDIHDLRIGYLASRDWERPDEKSFLESLRGSGAKLEEMQLPDYPYRAMLIVLVAEGAAAFDDLTRRGGLRELVAQESRDWPNVLRSARFIPTVEYLRAMRIRAQLIEEVARIMANFDVFVAPPFGNRSLSCTNLTGQPTCVLPLGKRANGTPTSITICGRMFGDADVLAIAEHWQSKTDWHLRRPAFE